MHYLKPTVFARFYHVCSFRAFLIKPAVCEFYTNLTVFARFFTVAVVFAKAKTRGFVHRPALLWCTNQAAHAVPRTQIKRQLEINRTVRACTDQDTDRDQSKVTTKPAVFALFYHARSF